MPELLRNTARGLRHPRARIALAVIISALLVTSVLVVAIRSDQDELAPNAGTKPGAANLTQVVGLPPGATNCPRLFDDVVAPFNAGARGTPMTSCPFVEQVRREYAQRTAPLSGPQQMRVTSPSTGKWYDLVCTPTGGYVTCTGGVVAVIYLYNA
jgi:hypothetical protein